MGGEVLGGGKCLGLLAEFDNWHLGKDWGVDTNWRFGYDSAANFCARALRKL